MKVFQIDCKLAYTVLAESHFHFHIQAADHPRQSVIEESLELSPTVMHHPFTDNGSGNRFFRLQVAQGPLEVRYRAKVQIDPPQLDQQAAVIPIAQLPDDVLHYLLPTRYCESDRLSYAAQRQFRTISPMASGYERVTAVCNWIRENVDYQLGTSTATTTALDVFINRRGVCRDFAHLGITLCRALNIPARFVVGYIKFDEPPPDFHAIFEAYIGNQWVLFDPTGLAPTENLVRVGTGRDAKDVAFATIYGPAQMTSMAPVIEPDAGQPTESIVAPEVQPVQPVPAFQPSAEAAPALVAVAA